MRKYLLAMFLCLVPSIVFAATAAETVYQKSRILGDVVSGCGSGKAYTAGNINGLAITTDGKLCIDTTGLSLGSVSSTGKATTAAPSYTNNTDNPLSMDLTGNLRVICISGCSATPAVATTDKGGTVTLGGTAQAAIALNASRKGWCVMNDPAATETLYVRVNGTASATTGVALTAGAQACNGVNLVDTAAVSVFAATTGHRWYGFEAQ